MRFPHGLRKDHSPWKTMGRVGSSSANKLLHLMFRDIPLHHRGLVAPSSYNVPGHHDQIYVHLLACVTLRYVFGIAHLVPFIARFVQENIPFDDVMTLEMFGLLNEACTEKLWLRYAFDLHSAASINWYH